MLLKYFLFLFSEDLVFNLDTFAATVADQASSTKSQIDSLKGRMVQLEEANSHSQSMSESAMKKVDKVTI